MKTVFSKKAITEEIANFADLELNNRLIRHLNYLLLLYADSLTKEVPRFHKQFIHDVELLMYFLSILQSLEKSGKKRNGRKLPNRQLSNYLPVIKIVVEQYQQATQL